MPARDASDAGPLTLGEMLARTTAFLTQRGSPSPRLDAELVIAHALGLQRIDLYTGHDRPVNAAERDAARALVARRARREPVAYILGSRGFRALTLTVTPDVLVPRPETELLVEWVVAHAPEGAEVLDWGTGSGAIAIALATERPDLVVCAVDISQPAIEVARVNAAANGAVVEFVHGDGFAPLEGRRFHVVVANPPYLSDVELAAAPAELSFEPAHALTAGPQGDELLRQIALQAPVYLHPEGALIVEIGESQGSAVDAHMRSSRFGEIAVHKDLAGKDRAVSGRLGG